MSVRKRLQSERVNKRAREWWAAYSEFRFAQFCPNEETRRAYLWQELTR